MEAVISVATRDTAGAVSTRDAIIDTGFSGYLTLPTGIIAAMQLPFVSSEIFLLGDNSQKSLKVYGCTVLWDGLERDVDVLASDTQPLVGMALLKGSRITIDAVDGGDVCIAPRS
jgi:clan AA aspartic protease